MRGRWLTCSLAERPRPPLNSVLGPMTPPLRICVDRRETSAAKVLSAYTEDRLRRNPMLRAVLVYAVLLSPLMVIAQDAVQTDGDKYKVIFENECVRVLDYKDRPGEATHRHSHPAFVLYALSAFRRSISLPDGQRLQRQFKEGDVMWSDSQTHIGTNSGETPTHVILVEMKGEMGSCAKR